jgi:HPt (histidine-containing phosphotransfer) domain-containing protein
MNHALRLLDQRLLAPSLLQASPEVLRRARLLASLLVLFVACNVMFMVQMILSGIPAQAASLSVVLGFYLASLAVVRVKGSLVLATHLFVGPLLTLVLGYVAQGGGVYAATTWPWSVLGVSLAYLLGGPRVGRAWFLVHTLAVVICTALGAAGHLFPTLPPAGPVAAGFGVLMLTVMFVGVIQVYERMKEQMVRSLEESGARTRLVLDNIGDGFLLVGPDGHLTREHSKAVEHWFGPVSGQRLWDYLCDDDTARLRLRLGWEELVADVLPRELLVEQMPTRVRRGERTFSVHYRVVGGDRVDAVVVITRDITLELAASAAEEERAEHVDLFERFARDPEGFRGFLRECRVLAEGVGASVGDLQKRTLHTLKGNAAIFGAVRVASWCHRLEDRLAAEEELSDEELHELRRRLDAIERRFATLLDARAGQLNVEAADVDALRAALRAHAPLGVLEAHLDGWRGEPLRVVLERMAEQARGLARRLGHGDIETVVDAPHVRVPRGRFDGLVAACAHLLRNAVDHGMEPRDARLAQGKPAAPQMRFAATLDAGAVVFTLADDGRGVDWEKVRAKAETHGMPHATREDLVAALFADGLSTRSSVSELSGRGVGMAAVRASVARLGGTIEIQSEPGQGTALTITLPDTVLAASLRSAPPPRASVAPPSEHPRMWH